MDLLRGIETHALALRGAPPSGAVMALEEMAADIHLMMERPLHAPAPRMVLQDLSVLDADGETLDASALYTLSVVDATALARHIRHMLQQQAQVTLAELVARRPLRHGLAELVTYLQLGSDRFDTVVDESARETVSWEVGEAADVDDMDHAGRLRRTATLPRVVFVRAPAVPPQP